MFQKDNTAQNEAPVTAKWKANGFINLYLTDKDGKRRKLGAIPLKDSNPRMKTLRAWLEEDPSRVSKVVAALSADYQPATQANAPDFDIVADDAE